MVSNNTVVIDKIEYNYEIISINENFFTDNINTYQIINIMVNIPTKYKFNNLSLNLQFLKENKRIIDYIIRR